jgi:hypothetical protein
MANEQPWVRQDGEGERSGAYDAFKAYLHLGKDRTIARAAAECGRSASMLKRWSIEYNWVERSAAYDSYTVTAHLDGAVHELARIRDKNLALMDKLRGLLDTRLDVFIAKGMDPTAMWSRAVEVMARVEQNSILAGDKAMTRQSEGVTRIEQLLERLDKESTG